jgi:hypothetical protein
MSEMISNTGRLAACGRAQPVHETAGFERGEPLKGPL